MTRWLAHYEEDGEVLFRIGRESDELIAEWIGLVRLVARRDGTSHRVERDADGDLQEIHKIERGSVRLLLRHLHGQIALHGAAVARDGKAVAMLGRARHGKSTLAAALCRREGVALLADDAVAVDAAERSGAAEARGGLKGPPPEPVDAAERSRGGFTVTALEELHWLDVDACAALGHVDALVKAEAAQRSSAVVSRRGKVPVTASQVGQHGKLVALVDLAFCDGPPRLVRLSPMGAMAALVPQAVRFVLDEPAVHRREMEMLGHLLETVPVYRLERPRSLPSISRSCDLVLDLLRGDDATGG